MKINIHLVVNRAVQILLLYLFFTVMAESLFAPILAVFITESINGATLKTVGFALALYAIAKSIVQVPLARYLDTHDGEKDDFYVLIVGAVFSALYPFAFLFVYEKWHLYLLEIFAGVSAAFLMAAYYSLFARHVDKKSEGLEWSLFSVWGLTVSSAVGAALGGWFVDLYGFAKLFLISGAINLVIIFILPMLYPLLGGQRPKALPPFEPMPHNPTLKK
ncbi:MAG: MFS transporter [Patescibacteria group bacterium]